MMGIRGRSQLSSVAASGSSGGLLLSTRTYLEGGPQMLSNTCNGGEPPIR